MNLFFLMYPLDTTKWFAPLGDGFQPFLAQVKLIFWLIVATSKGITHDLKQILNDLITSSFPPNTEDKLDTNKLFFGSVAIHNNKCICSLFAGVQQHDKSSQSDALGSLCFVQFVCFALYFQAVKNKSVFFLLQPENSALTKASCISLICRRRQMNQD